MSEDGFQRLESCFACGSAELAEVGRFRYLSDQAGFVPDEWLSWCRVPATLVRCVRCGSQGPLRRPSPELLAAWYARQSYAAADLISEGHRRAASHLRGLAPASLVDVGCGAGTFLDLLGSETTAYGLEPSLASAEYGRSRRRHIVAPDASGWSAELPPTVDVITLFDVIEHVPAPRLFLSALLGRLRPGGRVMIFTGNAGSPWAQQWNIRWWYHGWAGHLSCFSAAGLGQLAGDLGLEREDTEHMVYIREVPRLRTLIRGAPLRIASRLGALRVVDGLQTLPPPVASCPLGIDHMLMVARTTARSG